MAGMSEKYIVKLEADNLKLHKKLEQSEKRMKKFDMQAKSVSKGINASFLKLGAGLAVGGIGIAIKGMVDDALQAADKIQKLGIQLGLSTEFLSEMQHAANLTGTSIADLENGIRKMQKSVGDANDGLSTAKRAFEDLGLSSRSLAAMSPEQQFMAVAEGLARIESASKRTQVAMNIFGRAGGRLNQLFAGGAGSIEAYRKEAQRLGISLSQDVADQAAKTNDAITRLDAAWTGFTRNLTDAAAAPMESFLKSITEGIIAFNESINPNVIERIQALRKEIDELENKSGAGNRGLRQTGSKRLDEAKAELDALLKQRDELRESLTGNKDITEQVEKTGSVIEDVWVKALENSAVKMETLASKVVKLRQEMEAGNGIELDGDVSDVNYLRMAAQSKFESGNIAGGMADLDKAAAMVDKLYKENPSWSQYLTTQLDLIEKLAKESESLAADAGEKQDIGEIWSVDEGGVIDKFMSIKDIAEDYFNGNPVTVPLKFDDSGLILSDSLSTQVDKTGTKQ